MKQYAVLCHPGHNRVYFKSSLAMAAAEFTIASHRMSAAVNGVAHKNIAGLDCLAFSMETGLTPDDVEILSGLSFVFAIFEIIPQEEVDYLRPIEKINREFIDESISSILKYTGKTNEIFTRMMINVACYSQGNTSEIKLLDPVAGKGTTLYEGLIKGFDVYGIEIGDKVVTEVYHYMKKFLETEKYKHTVEIRKVSGTNKSFTSRKYTFEIAKSKEGRKANEQRCFEIIAGNSTNAGMYYIKSFFDIIVGDLPYGVQHGNVTNEKQSSLTRNPSELLAACLPAWTDVLKPGGAIVLAWNTNVLQKNAIGQIFDKCGLSVRDEPAYSGFSHRVDQSIVRDIIVANKR